MGKGDIIKMFRGHGRWYIKGIKDGIPIFLGYLAASITIGISAKNAGLSALQATITSLLINASAGEFIGFTLMAANSGYIELLIMEAVANSRYLLMSCALSQKLGPDVSIWHRLLVGFGITDEIFGFSVTRAGKLDPFYNYGLMTSALPGWALGTFLGVILGNILPMRMVSALSMGLYGMFVAVYTPQARKDKIVRVLVILSFILSWAFAKISIFSGISSGAKTIILTVVISLAAAILFPVKEEEKKDEA